MSYSVFILRSGCGHGAVWCGVNDRIAPIMILRVFSPLELVDQHIYLITDERNNSGGFWMGTDLQGALSW